MTFDGQWKHFVILLYTNVSNISQTLSISLKIHWKYKDLLHFNLFLLSFQGFWVLWAQIFYLTQWFPNFIMVYLWQKITLKRKIDFCMFFDKLKIHWLIQTFDLKSLKKSSFSWHFLIYHLKIISKCATNK